MFVFCGTEETLSVPPGDGSEQEVRKAQGNGFAANQNFMTL